MAGDSQSNIRSVSIAIGNNDQLIPVASDPLWGAEVTIESDQISEVWKGKITSWSQDESGLLTIDVSELASLVYRQFLPAKVLRVGDWNGVEASWANKTIPAVFGGTSADPIRVPGMVADRVANIYVFALGECRSIGRVFKDNQQVTSGFSAFLGSPTQSPVPGIVYLQFSTGTDDAGRWPDVVIELVGLKLGASSEAECRNPARILYYILTSAKSTSWGLGVSDSDIDTASFSQAITDCDAAGFKIDGILNEKQEAGYWIGMILGACRGSLNVVNGKWTIAIDKARALAKAYDTFNSRIIHFWRGDARSRINRVIAQYRYRYEQRGGGYAGWCQRDDMDNQALLDFENEQQLELPLIGDHTAAGAIADYHLHKAKFCDKRATIMTNEVDGVAGNSVVSLTDTEYALNSALFYVLALTATDEAGVFQMDLAAYDDLIYATNPIGTVPDDPIIDQIHAGPSIALAPDVITDLTASPSYEVRADGTWHSYVDVAFTKSRNYLMGEIQLSDDAGTNWKTIAVTTNSDCRYGPLNPGAPYSIRVIATGTGGQAAPVSTTFTAAPSSGKHPADVTGFTCAQDTMDLTKIVFAWDAVTDKDLSHYEIREGVSWDISPIVGDHIKERSFTLTKSSNATYNFMIRAVDSAGNYSINPDTASINLVIYPSDVTGFTATQNGENVLLSWAAIPDLDLFGYEIREGSTWATAQTVIDATTDISVQIPIMAERTYNYWIAAKSTRRAYSAIPGEVSITTSNLLPKNFIVTQDEITNPTGTFNQTEIGTSSWKWKDIPGKWSDYKGIKWNQFPRANVLKLAKNGADYFATGTYIVQYDIGNAATAGISVDQFLFVLPAGVSATLDFRYSVNGTDWSPWSSFSECTKTFRYLEFRMNLTTTDVAKTPEVTRFMVAIDVPDIDRNNRVVVNVGGTFVPFGYTYNLTPKVVATAIGAGLIADVSNVTTTGFTGKVFNRSGTDVGGEINWISRGY